MNALPDATLHLDHWCIIRGRVGLVISVFLLTLGAAAIFTYLSPWNYIASATIEVQSNDSNLAESQLESIFSHEVLDPVIWRLDLQRKWSRNGAELSLNTAYDKLADMVIPDVLSPHSMRFSVQGTSPQEATLLANTIAQEFVDHQALQQQATFDKQLEQLKNDVRLTETAVSNLFAEAARLRTAAGYVDPNPDSSDTSLRPEESTTPTSEDKVTEIQANIVNLKSRLDALDHLKSDNLAQSVG
ncbi:MAG TPA: hypothetical protein VHS80_07110, partial [Chthoniobacterales bacterium]|nr:hypothetical protein [Chthoniobacterales bacterium]